MCERETFLIMNEMPMTERQSRTAPPVDDPMIIAITLSLIPGAGVGVGEGDGPGGVGGPGVGPEFLGKKINS